MEFLKTLEETFAPEKFIAQAEKNAQAVLSYVEPKELSKTLIGLTSDTSDFVRAQMAAFEAIATIAKTHTEEFAKQFTKSTASK